MNSSELLVSINQNINEAIYRSNVNGLVYVNRAFLEMFEFDKEEEAYTYDITNLYKNIEERQEILDRLKSKGSFQNRDVQLRRKSGKIFHATINSVVHYDSKGNVFFDGSIRDISNQIKERRKARSNHLLLESISKNINEGIYRSVNMQKLVYANDAFVKMFGFSDLEELLSINPSDLYRNCKDREELSTNLVRKGSVSNVEIEFRRKDETFFWAAINAICIIEDDGTVYFDGAIRNITEQKKAETALHHHAEMQRLLTKISTGYINLPLDKVEDSISESLKELGLFVGADRAYIFDIDFQKKTWSNAYEWSADGIPRELDNSQNLPINIITDIINIYLKGDSFIVEDSAKLENSEYRRLLMDQEIKSLVSVPIMAGKYCVGFVGFDSVKKVHVYRPSDISLLKLFAELMVNIHSRSQNERELNHLLNTTTIQNKRLKDFSYIISHNMRASVANLIGLAKVLDADPGNKEYLSMLKSTADKLNNAIGNINELLNFESEIVVLKREYCYLSETIANVLELNNQLIKEENIEVTTSVSKNLKIKAFPAYLESIFQNIITNAIKYGTTKDNKKIEIAAEKQGNKTVVSIKDYGLGIDLEKFKDKIFRLGARFHSTHRHGQGLGLFMTKHQVEAMGGSIEVESKINIGTTFKVFFNG